MQYFGLRLPPPRDRSALLTIYLLPESQYRMWRTSSRAAFQIGPVGPPPPTGLFLCLNLGKARASVGDEDQPARDRIDHRVVDNGLTVGIGHQHGVNSKAQRAIKLGIPSKELDRDIPQPRLIDPQ
jgi:hypothetical protein